MKQISQLTKKIERWHVAVIANIRKNTYLNESISLPDIAAEYDELTTVQAICNAIESDGHITYQLDVNQSLPGALEKLKPDICFNIAEGVGDNAREAQVPALLELLQIPYTHSGVEANAISINKVITKQIWSVQGLPTASFQVFSSDSEILRHDLKYPLFVKPSREGSGMGIDNDSIVHNQNELKTQIQKVVDIYKQPALVESYLPGREFTVAIIGNPKSKSFMRDPDWYGADGFHDLPIAEIDSTNSITPGIYGRRAKMLDIGDDGLFKYYCPAKVNRTLGECLQKLAKQAHLAIGAADISRVDIRLNHLNKPFLLEINTFPGLTPNFSDLCCIANADQLSYSDLILEILYLGARRWNLIR